MSDTGIALGTTLFGGVLGYWLASINAFREQRLKALESVLPVMIDAAYEPTSDKVKAFNTSLVKIWLFASSGTAKSIDRVASIVHDPNRGDLTKAAQQAIVQMRKELRPFPLGVCDNLSPEEIHHLHFKAISGGRRQV